MAEKQVLLPPAIYY